MVSLIWFILSLSGICAFSWIPVFIEAVVMVIYISMKHEANGVNALFYASSGVALFSGLKVFLGLSLSAWWIFLSPLVALALFFVPGGYTILTAVLYFTGLISVTTTGLIISLVIAIIFDVFIFLGMRFT